MKKKVILLAGGIVLFLATTATVLKSLSLRAKNGQASPTPTLATTPTPSLEEIGREDANFKIAESFVKNCPTFRFDGDGLELTSFEKLKCANCSRYEFFFRSRHGGYGDRSGMMTTQVITPHQIAVTIQNGKVTQALTDGKYDEIRGKMVLP